MIFNLHKNCTTTVKTLQTELDTCINKCTNLKNEVTDLSTQLQEQKAIYHYQTMCLEDKIRQLEGEKPQLTSTMVTRMAYWKKKYERLEKAYKKLLKSSKTDSQNLSVSDSTL